MVRKRFGRFDSIDRVEGVDGVRKLCFLGVLAVSFLSGIIIGSSVHGAVHEYAFLVPAVVVGILGMAYLVHRVFILKQKLFSDTEMELVDIPVHAVLEEDALARQASAEEGWAGEVAHRAATAPATPAGRPHTPSPEARRMMYTGRGRSLSALSGGSFAAPIRVVSEERLRQVAASGIIIQSGSPSGGNVTLASPQAPNGGSADWVSVTRRCALQRQDSVRQGAHNLAASMSRELAEQLQTVPE